MREERAVSKQQFDVLIIGAGLAGVGVACEFARECPDKRVAILERRERLGGTWDLFRYPGIRSDSDMFSFSYTFRPWHDTKVLADGPSIRRYIDETARTFGVDKNIHYGLKVIHANWSSADQQWTVATLHEASGETQLYGCNFLIACTGYYDYDAGFLPTFAGQEQFKGLRIHPQHWPEQLDYAGKKVVVIGSGATAVTLIPAMAEQTSHITMLQRSPSYIVSVPGSDVISGLLGRVLPKDMVYRFARRCYIGIQRGLYLACKRWPDTMQRLLLSQVRSHLGKDADMRNFTPRYKPWDQRLCAIPDGDLFNAINAGKASVVTGEIDSFNENGIRLRSGQQLDADIVITATGLTVQMLGGMSISVDGQPQNVHEQMTYKGVLVQDVPNMAAVFGYANAPWTLKAELSANYLCRLLKHMDANGKTVAIPRDDGDNRMDTNILGTLSSSYVQRGDVTLPRQGRDYPWQVTHHLGRDTAMLRKQPIADRWLHFLAAADVSKARAAP